MRMTAGQLDHAQWQRGATAGHYESYFLRANHPTRPLAFWIRYTLFSPRAAPHAAIGELWAVYFDGETGAHAVAKNEVGIDRCQFSREAVSVAIGQAALTAEAAQGGARTNEHQIAWDLRWTCNQHPLFLLPPRLYEAGFPRAKALVPAPMAVFHGALTIDGRELAIDGWVGSRNHNWGSRHTDQYAWGQVAGFDGCPDAFLELATARVKVGPWLTPPATLLVLRMGAREHRVSGLGAAFRARASVDGFDWTFRARLTDLWVEGRIHAPASAFVGLRYLNPPGGEKHCLNTKIASCELRIVHASTHRVETLATQHRAAFEILTEPRDHGIAIRA